MLLKRKFTFILSFSIVLFTSGIDVFPNSSGLTKFELAKEEFKKGIVYFNNMQYLAAAEFFRKAVGRYPDYYSARDYLARSYKLAGFTDSALLEYKKASEIYPENISLKNKIDYLHFKKSGMADYTSNHYIVKNVIKSGNLQRFGFPNAMDFAIDSENNIYITSFSSSKLVKVGINGKGTEVFRPNLSGGLYGIDIHKKNMIVSDFKNDTVIIYRTDGELIRKVGKPGNGEGEFHGPEGLCFDRQGNFYVVDSGNYRIQKFNSSGKFLLSFGKKGAYEGDFLNPSDIAVFNERLYVTDTRKGLLSVFDLWGNFIKEVRNDMLKSPRGINVHNSYLLISDEKTGVFYLNPENGSTVVLASENEKMKSLKPVSSVVGNDGFLYVLDSALNRIYTLSPVEKQYTNLEMDISTIDASKFPTIAVYLNVRNRGGKPVYGLNSENFDITEDNSKVGRIYSNYLKKKYNSASFVMLVDRSKEMAGRHNDLPWIADFLLKKMRTSDRVKLVNYNSQIWPGSRFDWSRRRTLNFLKKRKYGSGNAVGEALYRSVSDLVPKLNRRGVLLITNGKVSEESFLKYSPETIIDYAREHFVQINIVTLSEPNEDLKRIAVSTGGKIMRVSEIDSMRKIYDRVRSADEYRYVLIYDTYKVAPFRGWWTDLKIQVKYKGQKGIEMGGYFVP